MTIVCLSPDALRIGEATAQKIMEGPRFKGKILKIPGHYYVTTHLELLAHLLRYKMSKMIASGNITLQVIFTLYIYVPFSYIMSYLGTHCQSVSDL
jgi:hypothetical protein